jgi:two-component system, LytTR family, sensor kinase
MTAIRHLRSRAGKRAVVSGAIGVANGRTRAVHLHGAPVVPIMIPMTEPGAAIARADRERRGIATWKIAAVWMIPALLSTAETVIFASQSGHPIALWRAFVGEAPQWFGWALLTPGILALAERFPLRWPPRSSAVLVHAAASLAAGVLLALADALVNAWVRPSSAGWLATARGWFLGGLPATTLVYFAIVVAGYAWRSSARLREREREAAALEAELRRAQLGALRMQLQPHFLFNSLNAVMALVRDRDTERALAALALLGDVLRATVNAGDANEATLASELDFVRQYLRIEQMRFGDRLAVSFDTDSAPADALVPVFILQPFVENALKHGVLHGRERNAIAIGAGVEGGSLLLSVRDDGRGLQPLGNGGVGIANARRRLEHLYGARAHLAVNPGAGGRGVDVAIAIPLVRAHERPRAPVPAA